MNFVVHEIQSAQLKPYIQYLLFSHFGEATEEMRFRSFANTNYCLGILNNKRIELNDDGRICFNANVGIYSYITGIYLDPFDTNMSLGHDEICIDFTPIGYHHFFKFPPKTYLLDEDILKEAFGRNGVAFFETVFTQKSMLKRAKMIEMFFLKFLKPYNNCLMEEIIYLANNSHGKLSLENICKIVKQRERKIYHLFRENLDVSPKEYMRICRFRHSLELLKTNKKETLTAIAYEAGFHDQSHFIKEIKFFTGVTPKLLSTNVRIIQDKVWFGC